MFKLTEFHTKITFVLPTFNANISFTSDQLQLLNLADVTSSKVMIVTEHF